MRIATIHFRPKSRDPEHAQTLHDRVTWFATTLYRNGQIDRDYLCAWNNNKLVLIVLAVQVGALNPRVSTTYARKALSEARKLCSHTSEWSLQPGAFEEPLDTWRASNSLYLQAAFFGSVATFALRSGDSGLAVPIYTLPISADEREEIISRSDESEEFYTVWMRSGALEMQAWREHASIRSQTNFWGRKAAATIERATGKPTYLELFRYYAFAEKREHARRCPGCGGQWKQPALTEAGIGSFRFRCNRCRVVQDSGTSLDGSRPASIGEWRGGKPVAPASKLRQAPRAGNPAK